MAGLALPSAAASAANSPAKDKKRKRAKPKKDDDDSDAELEISAEDLVAADGDGETRAAEGGEDDDEEEAAQTGAAVARHVKREAQRRREQTLLLRGVLDEEQGKRFDAFRSVVIPRQVVKKLNKDLYDQNVPNNLTSVVAGMVKVFVADVVETARELQPQTADPTGPLKPYHLQLARLKLQERGMMAAPSGSAGGSTSSSTGLRPRKRLFRK